MESNQEGDVGIPQKSETSGMLVKIKMPKEPGVVVSKPESENEEDVMKKSSCKRVCEICKKEFSSGKALGGHMSSHVQLARDKKSMKQEKSADSDSAVEEKPYSCAVCGRRFPSMKALSGHMRCHPERNWKGINPPPSDATCTTSSTDDKEEKERVVDLTESLTGWSATGKRGRRAMGPEDDPVCEDAVRYLMMLARGEKDFGEGEVVERKQEVESGELGDDDDDDESSSNNSNKKRKKFGGGDGDDDDDDESLPTDHETEPEKGATIHTSVKLEIDLNQLPIHE